MIDVQRRAIFKKALAAGLPAFTSATDAQSTWPSRPVRLIVPYSAGGGTDAVARLIAERITHDTKWPIVVDNKPGGAGNIGLDIVAKAAADGYTLGVGQTANLAINPVAMERIAFNEKKDFVAVAALAEVPTILVVRHDAPWGTIADLVKAGRASNVQLKQGLAGTGTVGHLAGVMLARKAGLNHVLDIPYKGAASAITDLLGGQTDYMFATPQAVIGMIQAGRLRALAVTSLKRLPIFPNVPTVAESGYAGFQATDWKVLVAPAKTPKDVLQVLNSAAERALSQSVTRDRLAAEGSLPLGGSLEASARFLQTEQGRWQELIKASAIKFD
ncbi:tripartite tricarboxylate transporter substrate binding protein [Curvibacter sp. RS43]|uniref:Bug family tripartite tricarboxylate transporter substrate binding protein n=1 Tax=Curvibacter microcysteis TaxID=3026419 RepID=UPI002360BBA5|nr:tripartite tricarboxylate transporter substrate binding protein [Curvibacter sp. RS43]MDD0812849.1 tripartite tricarboxylate transporter substrate binding protein [Curvibacter sp. RS43]